jgi:hypothetical protein
LDPSWDENQIHIVGMLIDPSGRIDNAGSALISEAESNGLTSDTVTFDTSATTQISSTISSTTPSDTAMCDGSASVVVTGGSPPYSYLWDDPAAQTSSTCSSLCAGTYTVVITDCANTSQSASITINDPIITAVQLLPAPDNITLHPNPANKMAFLNVHLKKATTVSIKVFSSSGQLVINRDYGNLKGGWTLPLITKNLSAGIYAINLQYGDKMETKKLVIHK